jgi:hypothetical protein
MDTVIKVCDVLENVSLSAATAAPKWFACGLDDDAVKSDRDDKSYDGPNGCGDLAANFASHHLDYFVDENSICVQVGADNERAANDYPADTNNGHNRNPLNNMTDVPLHARERSHTADDFVLRPNQEGFGKESSWASIDGRRPTYMLSKQTRSLEKLSSDEDRTRSYGTSTYGSRTRSYGTYGTYRSYTDDSSRSVAVKLNDGGAACSGNDFGGWDNIGLGLFGIPLQWTHVVKKKSSWETSETLETASNSSGAYTSSSLKILQNSRDDHNSLSGPIDNPSMHDSPGEHYQEFKRNKGALETISFKERINSPKELMRELPSFGKSREFRSFGSNRSNQTNRSLEESQAIYSLKPTFMTAAQSKKLHDESVRYTYIIPTVSSDQISTASPAGQEVSIDLEHTTTTTTTIPYSSLSKSPSMGDRVPSPPPLKRKSLRSLSFRKS